jgi:hypothetical protein
MRSSRFDAQHDDGSASVKQTASHAKKIAIWGRSEGGVGKLCGPQIATGCFG